MSRLLGGFPRSFHERRRPAYELYPLPVHARVFGGGYAGAAVRGAVGGPAGLPGGFRCRLERPRPTAEVVDHAVDHGHDSGIMHLTQGGE